MYFGICFVSTKYNITARSDEGNFIPTKHPSKTAPVSTVTFISLKKYFLMISFNGIRIVRDFQVLSPKILPLKTKIPEHFCSGIFYGFPNLFFPTSHHLYGVVKVYSAYAFTQPLPTIADSPTLRVVADVHSHAFF